MGSSPVARVEAVVDLDAVQANLALLRRVAGDREVFAVVKADAYGHGAVPVARALVEAGCERLAVLSLEEGRELRAGGIEAPILLMGGVHEDPAAVVEARLTPTLHHAAQIAGLARAARPGGTRLPVHVEVDTAMRRMGVPLAEAPALFAALAAEDALVLEGVYTHFARADEPDLAPSLAQLADFRRLLAELRGGGTLPPLVHVANSAGVLAGKPLFEALPEANAVRPGLALYGVAPAPHQGGGLRPAMTLRARVAAVRDVAAGEPVGYNARFHAERSTRVATLAVGYADGIPVAASNRGEALLAGARRRFAGRVSMDYVGVEVGDAEVAVGDTALLFGAGPEGRLPVEEAASSADTIAYELLVRVGTRVPRRHVKRDPAPAD